MTKFFAFFSSNSSNDFFAHFFPISNLFINKFIKHYSIRMSSKNTKNTQTISQTTIDMIRLLRMNGSTYDQIKAATGVSNGTITKYTRGLQILPPALQKNILSDAQSMVKPTLEPEKSVADKILEENFSDPVEVAVGKHSPGRRFAIDFPPDQREKIIDAIDTRRLQELMEEPTGFNSPLTPTEWMQYYLEGKSGGMLKHSPHKWSKMQLEMVGYWEQHQRLMLETFRDFGKTMIAIGVLTYSICEDPDANFFVMSETKAKAAKRVKQVGDLLLVNKRIIADYGFLPHTSKFEGTRQSWKLDEITVKRSFKQTDPTLMSFSSDSKVATGAHFKGGVFDDVWSESLERNSFENKQKWLSWHDGELEGCLEDAWELWLLTRKGPTDLYQDIEDRQFHVVIKRPAVLQFPTDWEIIYKEVEGKKVFSHILVRSHDWKISDDGNGRFTIEFFLTKMSKMSKVKWESEYQLNPIAARGIYWNYADLRWIEDGHAWVEERKNKKQLPLVTFTAFLDPAFGQSARADYTALTVVASFSHKYYFLELYLKRNASMKDTVAMINKAFKEFPIRKLYVEGDLQQNRYVQRLKNKLPHLIIKGHLSRQSSSGQFRNDSAKRDGLDSKLLRIWTQLEHLVSDNRIYISKNLLNKKEFDDEFTTFPSCEHDDVLDSLGNCIECSMQSDVLVYSISG